MKRYRSRESNVLLYGKQSMSPNNHPEYKAATKTTEPTTHHSRHNRTQWVRWCPSRGPTLQRGASASTGSSSSTRLVSKTWGRGTRSSSWEGNTSSKARKKRGKSADEFRFRASPGSAEGGSFVPLHVSSRVSVRSRLALFVLVIFYRRQLYTARLGPWRHTGFIALLCGRRYSKLAQPRPST